MHGSTPVGEVSPLVAQENVLPFLRACCGIAPTYLSLGNHELYLTEEDLRRIEATGVVVLDNEYVAVHSVGVLIGGLTSGYVMRQRAHLSSHRLTDSTERDIVFTSWLSDFAAQPGFKILLSHHPEYYPFIPSKVNLILSGHAHGGQWRFYDPFKRIWRGVLAPGQGWFPKWTKGVYDGRLVVSAGLCNTTRIPRINNPTEIVYIEP